MNLYEKVRKMNYEEFSEFIDNQLLQPIIYDEPIGFEIYEINNHYFYYECVEEDDSDTFCEVKLVAELRYDVNHDIMLKSGEILSKLFDCDICGEAVFDDCIKYMWFKVDDNVDAKIITIWDNGTKIEHSCKYNIIMQEITGEDFNSAINEFENLQGVFLIFKNKSFNAFSWVRMSIVRDESGNITEYDNVQYFKSYDEAVSSI